MEFNRKHSWLQFEMKLASLNETHKIKLGWKAGKVIKHYLMFYMSIDNMNALKFQKAIKSNYIYMKNYYFNGIFNNKLLG